MVCIMENFSVRTDDITGHLSKSQRTQRILHCCRQNALLLFTMAGVLCGGLSGYFLRSTMDLSENAIMSISYPGEIFMRILKLIILPLVISSLISCCASLNSDLNGKIAARTFGYFICTSFLNSCLGVALAVAFQPGAHKAEIMESSVKTESQGRVISVLDAFMDIGRNIFPDNVFEALFQQTYTTYVIKDAQMGNASWENFTNATYVRQLSQRNGANNIGIIAISLIFGTVLGTLQTPSSVMLIEVFKTINQVVVKIMNGVMWFTPIGICSVICGKFVSIDDIDSAVSKLGWFVLTVVVGVLIHQFIFMQLIYYAFLRKNPFEYYWGLMPGMLTAFAAASTAAALPVTFSCMDNILKIDKRISRYILPIGCSINMDGTALFLSVAAVFIAQLNDFTLHAGSFITLILVCTAASMSSASVPSAALVLMLMVLGSIGCPTEDISLLFAVDWLVDRCRTTNNMLGDCYAAAVVEHLSRKELDLLDNKAKVEISENGQINDETERTKIIVNTI